MWARLRFRKVFMTAAVIEFAALATLLAVHSNRNKENVGMDESRDSYALPAAAAATPSRVMRSLRPSAGNVSNLEHGDGVTEFVTWVSVRSDIRLLALVTTGYSNMRSRRFIRATWGSSKMQEYFSMQVIFLLGRPPHKGEYTVRVDAEMKEHKDILQADFRDTYRNLTLKSLSLLYFVRDEAPDLTVIKVDDDVVVDPYKLSRFLFGSQADPERHPGDQCHLEPPMQPGEFVCLVHVNSSAVRNRSSKWFVTYNEWPSNETFPAYCDGPAYLFRAATADAILKAYETKKDRFLWLEDVYITGMLATRAGVSRRSEFGKSTYTKQPRPDALAALNHFGRGKGSDEMKTAAWRRIEERIKPFKRQQSGILVRLSRVFVLIRQAMWNCFIS